MSMANQLYLDYTDNSMKTLYQIDNKKQLRVWSIYNDEYTIIIKHGLVQGAMQTVEEPILIGKGSRTVQQQIESRMNSRISKQKAKGYRGTILEAKAFAGKNELNTFKPMLAQQFNKQKSVDTTGAVLQRKLDGNRMLVTRTNGDIIAYTRNGKVIRTLGHILDQMEWLEEGQTVDGEVYKHGMALKDIRGGVAKKQASTLELNYHIYDVVEPRSFKDRFVINAPNDTSNLVVEPWWAVVSKGSTKQLFDTVRKQGYEGLMMRLDEYGYQPGKRSKSLLKIKYRYDAEYEVIDIIPGKNNQAILIMRLPNGETVKGVTPGTKKEKEFVMDNADHYIGKLCTCSFAYLTEFGIPFHLTCDNWRT